MANKPEKWRAKLADFIESNARKNPSWKNPSARVNLGDGYDLYDFGTTSRAELQTFLDEIRSIVRDAKD